MNENQIVELLKQNVPQPDEPVTPVPQEPSTDEPSSVEHQGLDELTSLKMYQYFGLALQGNSSETTNQLNYIYGRISETIGNSEYPYVMQAVSQLERILGLGQDDRRLFKLYTWLRLDKIRQLTEIEMSTIHA